jgi:hypothetical protein
LHILYNKCVHTNFTYSLSIPNYVTNANANQIHHPKYVNSLIRIPGTYNSKRNQEVKIMQRRDGKRLSIQLLLKDFRRWIVQGEINENKKQSKKSKSNRSSFDKFNQKGSRIEWIEKLLQTPIDDYRNYCLWAILTPYLLNVKGISEEDTTKVLEEWLDKCNNLRRLIFNPRSKIYSTIKSDKGLSQSHIQNSRMIIMFCIIFY